MRHDARSVATGSTLEPDICIIGAGPAGISIALTLARAGVRVLLLESGGREQSSATQDFAKGESVGETYYPLQKSRVRGFGGTSLHWLTFGLFRAAPLAPLDFEQRPGVPYSGWPIDRSDLDPYYSQASGWCGLGPWDYAAKRWATNDRPELQFEGDRLHTTVFQLADVDTWRNRYDEVTATDGLRLLLHGHIVEMRTDLDGRRIERLRVRTTSGSTFEVAPRVTVLAAGGIENARMLLLNRDRHPTGLGNEYDLLGRFFQDHLLIRGGIIRPDTPDFATRLGLYRKHRHADSTRLHAKVAVDEQILRERRLLNCAFFITHVSRSRTTPGTRSSVVLRRALTWRPVPDQLLLHARRAAAGLPGVAWAAWQELRNARRPDTFQLQAEAEQAPNPDSRVTLSSRSRDAFGLPRARLEWRLTDLDRRSLTAAEDIIGETLRASRLGRLEHKLADQRPFDMFSGCWHHIGTTRMHDDPRYGVVDRDSRVHGMANLYVAGSSVFPTGGYANPTFTVVALALRLADHLKSELLRTGV